MLRHGVGIGRVSHSANCAHAAEHYSKPQNTKSMTCLNVGHWLGFDQGVSQPTAPSPAKR